jgi:hydrogenase/urease accessory protein HupE
MAGVAAPTVAVSSMTAALYLLIGGCLAAKWAPTRTLTMALGVGLGLLRGWAGFMDAPADPARAASLAGVAAAVFVALALSASITLPLRQGWTITAARVAGSWLAALGLLLAGWILRFGAAAL